MKKEREREIMKYLYERSNWIMFPREWYDGGNGEISL